MADNGNKKGTIYVDGHERPDVMAYMNWFCDQWFNKYFPHMSYFKVVDIKRVEPELNAGKT